MRNVHKLTEGAVLLAAFAVLLLITIYIPFLGIVSNLFLAVPFILFGTKNTRMYAVVFLIASLMISLIVGTILAIPLTLSFGMTGLVIGQLIKEGKSRTSSFIAATLVFLITLLLQYAVAVVFFNINFIEDIMSLMTEAFNRSRSMLEAFGQNPAIMEQFEAALKMLESLTPSLFVLASLFAVILIELVSFPVVKRFGVKVENRKPFREIVFPKSILWYYLITILATLIFKPEEGSYWFLALVNISFILQLLMVLQGLSFIYYICYKKGMLKGIPIIATIFTFILPIFLYIVRILGIIDLGFDLRKRFEKSE
ncbi:YybS family protein [Bacillus sp. FJAT-49705]|uniref:YybS family protein n=1 Tax=Cytobacillus citreus TaxID=2833586 RepID=A0ABS5NPU7_9BACI|nr:YybS family protein [Cytobacillus citreus]MBS4189852.1 YybS family protein [Cytobacillus citreus]